MIEQPRRSVTRFFIPLIDVLTLLFCVFLVMPMGDPEDKSAALDAAERQRVQDKATIQRLQEQLAALAKEKGLIEERVALRMLEIDGETGKLYYRDAGGRRQEVASQGAARTLIDNDRRALGVGRKELFYVVLYPRDPEADHPTGAQRQRYEEWLEGVSARFEKPGDQPRGVP